MASGGRTHLLHCPICFNEKDGRKPRTLQCQHSFCTECLIQWHGTRVRAKQDPIDRVECPVCKEHTNLPQGGIDSLPVDFKVSEASDILDAMGSASLCQKCSREGVSNSVEALCTDCELRFCKDCSTEHLQVNIFAAHRLVESMCKSHCAEVKYFCVTCVEGLCTKCAVFGTHKTHKLHEKEEGIKNTKAGLNDMTKELEIELENFKTALSLGKQACAHHLDSADQYIDQICEDVKKKIDEIFSNIKAKHREEHNRTTNQIYEEFVTLATKGEKTLERSQELLKQEVLHLIKSVRSCMNDIKETRDIIETAKLSLPNASRMAPSVCGIRGAEEIEAAAKRCNVSCCVENVLSPPNPYPKPKQMLKIECEENCKIVKPWKISLMPNGSAIVCEHDYRQVSRVFPDGNIERLNLEHNITDTAVNGNDILLFKSDGSGFIIVREDEVQKTIDYEKITPYPWGVCVQNDDIIVLHKNGIVRRGLSGTGDCDVVCDGENMYGLSMVRHIHPPVIVAAEQDKCEVIMYTAEGGLSRRFGKEGANDGQFKRPFGTTTMANGNLVIVDRNNHRICVHKIDGTFIENMLTEEDGLYYPSGIAYLHPYLWVVENVTNTETGKHTAALKIFRFET